MFLQEVLRFDTLKKKSEKEVHQPAYRYNVSTQMQMLAVSSMNLDQVMTAYKGSVEESQSSGSSESEEGLVKSDAEDPVGQI